MTVTPDLRPKATQETPEKLIAVGISAHGKIAIGVSAHGILAIGVVTHGIVSLGVVAMGVISCGLVSMGVLSVGAISMGLYGLSPAHQGHLERETHNLQGEPEAMPMDHEHH